MGCEAVKHEYHTPVLLEEVINHGLVTKIGQVVCDVTFGGGGHASAMAEKLSSSDKLIVLDKDINAIQQNKSRVKTQAQTIFVHDGFENLKQVLHDQGIDGVDFILADLGVSSHQIDCPERGFSYMHDGRLDMRMDSRTKRDAFHVVNHYSGDRLKEIIKEYGEERYAGRITDAIIKGRPINTTNELSKIIVDAVPGNYFRTGGHPAKRTFQAIRIEVNRELENLERFLTDAVDCLNAGGRIAVITFHSLEDRIVKQTFKYMATECLCPPKSPKCICGKIPTLKVITKKPILPTADEIKSNPRSASAKLRIAEKQGGAN